MTENHLVEKQLRIRSEKRWQGAIYGLVAGLVFSLAMWGVDAFLLWQASADFPWLKWAAGAPAAMFVGLLAGWLTVLLDHALVGFFAWLLAGLAYVWLGSHVPFEGVSWLIGWFKPELRSLEIYPFVESARVRMIFLYPFVALLTGLGGSLELAIVENVLRSRYALERFFRLFWLFPIYIGIGLLADNLINIPLREPVVALNNRIELRLNAEATNMPSDQMRRLGLRVVEPFGALIHQPYALILGNYDPESITEANVFVNFAGVWGSCSVVAGTPGFCQLSTDRYLKKIACVLAGGEADTCQLGVAPEAQTQVQELVARLGPTPELAIQEQRGNVILWRAQGSDGEQFLCRLRITRGLVIEACQPAVDRQALPFTNFPSEKPTPTAAPVSTLLTMPAASEQLAVLSPQVLPLPAELQQAPQYALALQVAEDLQSFTGLAQVVYTNTEASAQDALFFRLFPNGQRSYGNGSLQVGTVKVNQQAVATRLLVQDSALQIYLPEPLPVGGQLQITLPFTGSVPVDFGPGYGIFNLSQEVLALSGWYPLLAVYDEDGWNLDPVSEIGDSVYSEMAWYSVELQAPETVVWATSGEASGVRVEDHRQFLRLNGGVARDFFLIGSPRFQVLSTNVADTTLAVYYLPGLEQAAQTALEVATDSFRIFSEKFGPYPYRELDIVAAPMQYALGVEFPGIVLIALELYDQPQDASFAVTIAHELAHQWWYNAVGNDVFDEPWLDEGLTTYSSSLYYEFRPGGGSAQGLYDYWQQRYDRLVQEGKDDQITAALSYFEGLEDPGVYGSVVYVKAALFFKALREEIGEAAFFSALQEYYRRFRFRVASGPALLELFEQAAGRELDDFYQRWLYTKGS